MSMREILFRGRRIDNNEWVYGGFHKHLRITPSPIGMERPREDDYDYLIIESGFSDWNLPKPIDAHRVIPESVGQFTGMRDGNNKEIYEGNIVRFRKAGFSDDAEFDVKFENGSFYLKSRNSKFDDDYIGEWNLDLCQIVNN